MANEIKTKRLMELNQKFWKRRNEEILRYVDAMDADIIRYVRQAYDDAFRETEKKIFEFYGRYAEENQITRQGAEKVLSTMDLKNYQKVAEAYRETARHLPKDHETRLRAEGYLKKLTEGGKAQRLEGLLFEIRVELDKLSSEFDESLEQHYYEVGNYVHKHAWYDIRAGSTINRPAIRQMMKHPFDGSTFSDYVWGNTDRLTETLRRTFAKGFTQGLGVRQMASEVRKDFNVQRANAEAIVRTEGNHIINNATLARYADAGLKYARIHVHRDDRTSDICIKHDEEDKLYTIGEDTDGVLPAHVNCRSGWIPDRDELMDEHWLGIDEDELRLALENYVAGGFSSIRDVLTEEQFEFILENMEELSGGAFRIEGAEFTFDKFNLKKGSIFDFDGNLRSFTRERSYANRIIEMVKYEEIPMDNPVMFSIVGDVQHFNIDDYAAHYFENQFESFIGGQFEVLDIINQGFFTEVKIRAVTSALDLSRTAVIPPINGFMSNDHGGSIRFFKETHMDDYYEWGRKLTRDHTDAIRTYTGTKYRPMNFYMRSDGELVGYKLESSNWPDLEIRKMNKEIDLIKEALVEFAMPETTIVYRGVESGNLPDGYLDDLLNSKLGRRVVLDNGFMSSAVNEYPTKMFGDVKYRIEVPKGSKVGAYIAEHSKMQRQEDEFLFHPNVEYEIVNIYEEDGKRHFDFRAIGIREGY